MAIKFGSQFLINTFANSDQEELSLAGLANGLFVGAYNAGVPFGNGDGIKFQVFNADGSKRGAEQTLTGATQFTTLVTRDPDVAAAPDASFYIAGDVGNSGVNGGRHTDIDLNSLPNLGFGFDLANEVAIAVRSDGARLAVFQSSVNPAGPTDPNIRAAVFSPLHPTGIGENGEIVNSNLPGVQTRPDVAALTGGRFVTVFETGALSSAFRFTDVIYGPDPNLVGNPTATFMTGVGGDTLIQDARHPVVAALPGDRFVVLWYHPLAIDRAQILGRVYDSNGNSQGDFVAAHNNVAFQELSTDRDIAVAVSPNGHFMVAWTGLAGTIGTLDNSGTYIDAAVFNSNGIPGTNSFLVIGASLSDPTVTLARVINESLTTITAGNQFDPSLTALADGRFVLGWTDASASAGDTLGLAVRGQIFDTRSAAINVHGTPGHDDYVGTDFVATGLGNDTFNGGAGDDTLDGRAGVDSARFSGPRSAYTIQELGAGRVVVAGPDGTDTLTSIETLIFDDLTVTVNVNQPPVISFNGGGDSATLALKENTLAVATIAAFDPDFDPLTFAIIGGADQARFQIDSGGHLRFLVAPDFEAPTDADGNRSYIVQVRVSAGGQSDTQTVTVNITDAIREPATPLDFNGEGTSDILLRRTDGTFSLDLIDNLHVQSNSLLGHVGNELHAAAIGNFDNDRDSDLLLRHDNGGLSLYRFQAGQVQSVSSLGNVGNELDVAGNGDFDGDGDRDLLMRHDNGNLFLYRFEAGQVQSASPLGQVGNELHVAGIGDFDGDDDADLLVRRDDGNLFLYQFQAGQVQSATSLGNVGNEQHVATIGDFDNDGDSDLLTRHDDGTLFLYRFQNAQVQSATSLGNVGNEWQVAGSGDYDADNDFDVLLRQGDGALRVYEIEAGQVQSVAILGAVGLEWHVV